MVTHGHPNPAGRRYHPLLERLTPLMDGRDTRGRMQVLVDALWDEFGDEQDHAAYSWLGFYFKVEGADEMTLGPRRDKPACSPIGLHGVCGRGYREATAILVDDIESLAGEYIACDPRDRSEIVVPLFDADGQVYAVFDGDSYGTGSFGEHDAHELARLFEQLGLTQPPPNAAAPQRL